MIKTESYELAGRQFVRTYSDVGRSVVRDGVEYTEANDPAELGRTYTEGDPIPDTTEDKAEAYGILTGVNA